MKITRFALIFALASSAFAGDPGKVLVPVEEPEPFYKARRPVTNPVLFDLAQPMTKIHPLVIHQTMPSFIDTTLGQLPVGGDFQVYAVQAELAVNDRMSIVAAKDGYIVFDPNSTFSKTSGWANLAAGGKFAWLFKPEQGLISSMQLLYEIPSGDTDVWQGTGDGQFIPSIYTQYQTGRLQLANAVGFRLPVDDGADSTQLYTSAHAGFNLTRWLYPLVEINWFHVMDPGDGASRFGAQAGGITPAIARFEAGDLVNWGALNSEANSNLVTAAVGFRANPPNVENIDFGFAWEFPLTDDDATILEDRFTFDIEVRF